MLNESSVFAVVAVKDMAQAKQFYGETLGLKPAMDEDAGGGVMYQSGNGRIYIYSSQYAGTNQATVAGWEVSDLEGAIAELKGKGITFEHYDFPDVEHQGDIHIMGGTKAAWFKDPEGNILSLGTN
jgi:catechol 2,3-dioxygenase-like lactoylglutathione lyase family enzyme